MVQKSTQYFRHCRTVPCKRQQWHVVDWLLESSNTILWTVISHSLLWLFTAFHCGLILVRNSNSFLYSGVQTGTGTLASRAEWPKRKADHLSAFIAEIRNAWMSASTLPFTSLYEAKQVISLCVRLHHCSTERIITWDFSCVHRNAVSVSRINVQYEIRCLLILNNRINNS